MGHDLDRRHRVIAVEWRGDADPDPGYVPRWLGAPLDYDERRSTVTYRLHAVGGR